MARIEHSQLPSYFDDTKIGDERYTLNLYNIPDDYNYNKDGYQSQTSSVNSTYRGTIEIPAGLTQKGINNDYPLMHAKDIQIGNNEANRLTDKLADYDQILRELYGRAPSQLEDKSDGRTNADIATLNQQEKRSEENNNLRVRNGDGLQSLDKIATVLNNRTETIDDRLLDLRMFKTIKIDTDKGSNTNDLENGTKAIIDADNNSDILTINSENQWIILKGNNTNNSFTIGHYQKKITPTTSRINLNDDSIGTIVLQNLTYDDAGHVTNELNTEYTLPYSFKTMKVSNNDSTDNIASNSNSIEANTVFANMQFIAGNKWINLAANNTNRTITIAHTRSKLQAESHSLTYALSNQSPKFGSNFSIANPTISFTTDAAGHVTEYSSSDATVTVKIPEPSLEVAKDINEQNIEGNVIVALNWDLIDKGKLIYTPAYIGSLTLTGYTALNENSTGGVVANTDTLNDAIAKLQKQIEDGNGAITRAKEALYGGTIPTTDALTLKSLAEQKLDKKDFKDFKIMYNDLIEQLATDLSWTDERKTELQFDIPIEEEQPENTGE